MQRRDQKCSLGEVSPEAASERIEIRGRKSNTKTHAVSEHAAARITGTGRRG